MIFRYIIRRKKLLKVVRQCCQSKGLEGAPVSSDVGYSTLLQTSTVFQM